MCWIGEYHPLYAFANMKTFKIVRIWNNNTIYSLYHKDFEWKLGEEYKINLDENIYTQIDIVEINRGFHCYDPDEVNLIIDKCGANIWSKWKKLDGEFTRCRENNNLAVMECIIPEGSEYFENKYGEIVTEKLKPISITKIFHYK